MSLSWVKQKTKIYRGTSEEFFPSLSILTFEKKKSLKDF